MKIRFLLFIGLLTSTTLYGQQADSTFTYSVELGATAGNGTYAPLWFTANRYGLSSVEPNSGYLRAGVAYDKSLKYDWRIQAGFDLAGSVNHTKNVHIQQIYADFSWKMLTLSIGRKERQGFPLEKNAALSSGMMVEGMNALPVPQVRGEIKEYWSVPGTAKWLALKGHMAYGYFPDGKWQENFVAPGQRFTREVLYHSKALMFRLGNKEKFPAEFEFGLMTAAQFGGDLMKKNADGTVIMQQDMPDGLKDYWKIFIPFSDKKNLGLLELK